MFYSSGEALTKLAKCEFNGETYYEGELIDSGESCFTCFCAKGFENKPVEENKHCHKINCNIELHFGKKIAAGCIPIYYKTESCCPIDWKCPTDKTTVVADNQCAFGKLKMNIGDVLPKAEEDNECTTCSCKIPPHPYCIQTC